MRGRRGGVWARRVALVVALALLGSRPALAGELELHGVLAARQTWTRGQASWLQTGFGRLPEGAGGPRDDAFAPRGQAHLAVDWKPSAAWQVHAHGVLHGEPSAYGGRRAGLVEAFVQFRPELSVQTALRLRAGTFFPQTSLENSEALWQSPYTLTLSALNTWAAEELRPSGLDGALQWESGQGDRLELAGAAFGLDDAAGALIAWRGWSLGDRLTSAGELLPLPRLTSLAPGGAFETQRAGTRPLDELDGRLGWQARARWSRPGGSEARLAYFDNRGDRALHRGQYAWATAFLTAGLELRFGTLARLLAEGASGSTGMGHPGGPRVDLRFRVGYLLLSLGRDKWRASARVEGFKNRDLDGVAEPNQESGWAFTVAGFWQPAQAVRLGAEYLELRAQRPAAAFSGADPDTDARRALLELRLRF